MKLSSRTLLVGLTLFLISTSTFGQGPSRLETEFQRILRFNELVTSFDPESLTGLKYIEVPMNFADDDFNEDRLKDELKKHHVIGVTLIYTRYRTSPDFDQRKLNMRRLKRLHEVAPYLYFDDRVQWSVKEQVGPTEREDAVEHFHGFILFYTDLSRYSSFAEIRDRLDSTSMSEFRPKEPEDTLLQAVFNRHPEWVRMNVHCDLTGSMSPYTAQLLVWFKQNIDTRRILQFVFFNDGDDMMNSRKRVNRTGGIYMVQTDDMQELLRVVQDCMSNGNGGDIVENDIEALMTGIQNCRGCAENVLIADNLSAMRDYGMRGRLREPVRIVLCGTQLGINTQYLDLARDTRGSVHTIDEDFYTLNEMRHGDVVTIAGKEYELYNGKFREKRERRGPRNHRPRRR